MKKPKIQNIVVLSDLHAGSQVAVWPPGIRLPNGSRWELSPEQRKLKRCWDDFWEWIDERLDGQPFITVLNGDMIEGVHHHAKDSVTQMWNKHVEAAATLLKPHTDKGEALYYVYGTEAHVGSSAEHEESLAGLLGAELCKETGQHGRWELWMEFGEELIHFSHHIGTTSSQSYEASAPNRELANMLVEAGRFRNRPPSIVIRSHRHRYVKVSFQGATILVTPAWQLKTPFVYKVDRARTPEIGGLIIRQGVEGVHVREKIWPIGRPKCVKV